MFVGSVIPILALLIIDIVWPSVDGLAAFTAWIVLVTINTLIEVHKQQSAVGLIGKIATTLSKKFYLVKNVPKIFTHPQTIRIRN